MYKFGVKIALAIKEKGISQKELARIVNISQNGLINYLKDKRSVDAGLLGRIAQTLDKPIAWFYDQHDLNNKNDDLNISDDVLNFSVKEKEPHYIPKIVTVDTSGKDNVVLVPAKAAAGYLRGFEDPQYMSELPSYRLPNINGGTFRMFEITGESMYPTLKDADIVVCEWVTEPRHIRSDNIHVIITSEGILVKRVENQSNQGFLLLHSDNHQYEALKMPLNSIYEVWHAKMYISKQFHSPGQVFDRLDFLEGEVQDLKTQVKRLLNPP